MAKSKSKCNCLFVISLQVLVDVDTDIKQTRTIVGDYAILSSRVMYVAGSASPGAIGDVRIVDNFRGCLKQVGISWLTSGDISNR